MAANRQANDFIRALGLDPGSDVHPSNIVFATGVIDSSYSSGWPKITFDGESTMGSRQYPFLSSYAPAAGDRVILAMLANSGIILGRIGDGYGTSAVPNSSGTNTILSAAGPNGTFRIAIQDGSGRVEMYWNVDGGAGSNTYHVSNEGAVRITIDPVTGFNISYAPPGTAGQAITWSTSAIPSSGSGAWQTPSYQNGWAAYSDPQWGVPAYMKNAAGIVRLRGLIQSGTIGSTAFTLPAGCRPEANGIFVVDSNGAFGEVRVYTNGNVVPNMGSNSWVSLWGVSFLAEN